MRRALRGVLALVLTAGAVSAAAAGPDLPGPHDEKNDCGDGARRLDEMKVNLALLSDPVTFPYYLCAHAEGESMEVGGCVPGEAVRRHALELSRRNCSRTVTDRLVIRADLNPRPPLRVEVMEKEGSELLVRELGEAGRHIRVEARPDGLVTVLGPTGSVEEKLAVSRLFRQVAGCTGVVNQLSVHPIMRDGHRVIPVTRDGSQTVPLAALGGATEHAVRPPAPRTVAAPSPLHALHGAEAHKEELSLPLDPSMKSSGGREEAAERTTPAPKPASKPASKPVTAEGTAAPSGGHRTPSAVDALSAPKPPTSWKEKETDLRWEPVGEARPVVKTSVPAPVEPPAPAKPASKEEERRTAARPPEAQATVNSPLERSWRWRDYGKLTGSSKPGPIAAATPAPSPESREASNRPSELPPLRSARAWPPAFAPRSQEPANGRPGVIVFDEPAPSASAAPHGPVRPARPAALVDLVRKVNAACGKQARDVLVEVQRDGSLLVKVKATAAAEKQLMSRIMTIPDMASPNVHLAMEIIP